ncbi:RodZ domain-containing protein [Natronospira sp.]|uniref:RodZ domain-containing protein n=1 Tax=Natronospira sp. TaxID=2024970 RepID=UPI00387345AD
MTDEPSRGGSSDNQERPPDGSPGPGSRLRDQRESLGLTLEQVGQELRILPSILRALEEDRFEVLEAPIFVRGHLRNYARLLDLPAEEIVDAYNATLPSDSQPALELRGNAGPAMDSGTPAWVFTVAWIVVLAMLVMGGLWWYAGPHREPVSALDEAEERVEPVAERDEAVETVEDSPLTEEIDEDRAEPEEIEAEPSAVAEMEEESPAADPEQEPVAEADETLPAAAELLEPEVVAPDEPVADVIDEEGSRSLTVILDDDSWIEIYDDRDQRLYYGLAREGERVEVAGLAPISIFMGNAPAVSLEVDGEVWEFGDRIRRDNTARITVTP